MLALMKKWRNLQITELGRYKLFTILLATALTGMILWQGVLATSDNTNFDAFAMPAVFGESVGDGLHEQRAAAWAYAVSNPSSSGGVWGRFWEEARFGLSATSP